MKANGRPILNAIRRAYSAQAQPARGADKVSLGKQQPKVTKLGNGTIVASLENNSPVARVAVLYNAGPRYEAPNQKGITHCIRSAINISTEKSTAFAVTKNVQQIGGSLSCTSTKEQMIYNLVCTRNQLDSGFEFLGDVATRPAFRPWEMAEVASRCKSDLAFLEEDAQAQLAEAIHSAAYRDGLGHSLYCPSHKIGQYSPDQLQSFVSTHYTSSNVAIVGLGVDHDDLVIHSKGIKLNNSVAPAPVKSTYNGAQVRIENNNPLVQAAIVTEGVGIGSSDLLTLYVLQKVMGSGHYVKYGTNVAVSKVAQAAGQATANPFAASCINLTYSDSGLFGFQVAGQASDMGKILKSVVAAFGEATKGTITDADVTRAKNQLKAAFMMELESAETYALDFGIQALLGGQILSVDDVSAAVDKITTADINNVAKKVINGKPAMAAVGDLSSTPYLDQLF